MVITESQVAQAASELKPRRGGVNNDYFGLLFLEKEFKLSREEASEQIAYGGNDFGIDGYHIASVITPKPASRDHFKTGQPSDSEQHCL